MSNEKNGYEMPTSWDEACDEYKARVRLRAGEVQAALRERGIDATVTPAALTGLDVALTGAVVWLSDGPLSGSASAAADVVAEQVRRLQDAVSARLDAEARGGK